MFGEDNVGHVGKMFVRCDNHRAVPEAGQENIRLRSMVMME